MVTKVIAELQRLRSILSGTSGLEDDDQEYIEDARKSVDQLIERLAEQPAPVQQGWKLVPYEPSIDMQEQGSIASGYDLSQARVKKVYQAMIDMHDVMMEREPTDEWFRLQAGYPEQQAQRKWVGLSEEDREQHRNDWHSNIHDKEFQAIEAKLKEKNRSNT